MRIGLFETLNIAQKPMSGKKQFCHRRGISGPGEMRRYSVWRILSPEKATNEKGKNQLSMLRGCPRLDRNLLIHLGSLRQK